MNFFGHSVVASWRSGSAGVALGAMLPDFAGMCRARIREARDPEVAAGIELHHETDRVFHRLAGFCEAIEAVARQLRDGGLGRGPAAGAAHVAVELCLDRLLLDEPGAAAHYQAALAVAEEDAGSSLVWAAPEEDARWRGLVARLAAYGAPTDLRDEEWVSARVVRALSGRPLLALDEAGAVRLEAEMPRIAERTAALAPGMMAGLRAAFLVERAAS
jgi:hypothetical protein